ncbi:sulfurtransferase TusA family protein [Cellulomonas sp. P22]|uniref:sulfurtransferase TusA family protein n=1 Tax=Cellulomonas sp. P22 TaxID=3373189 RepID=UPI0037A61712
MTGSAEPVVVDARGERCPMPVIRLARTARELPAGALLTVLATDPAARLDVPAWARMRGHTLVGVEELADGGSSITVRLEAP